MGYSLFLLGIVIVFTNSPLGIFGSPFPEPNASNASNGTFSSAVVDGDADGNAKMMMGPIELASAENSSSSVAPMLSELTNAPEIIGEQVAKPNQADTDEALLQSLPAENPDKIHQLHEEEKIKSEGIEAAKEQQKDAPQEEKQTEFKDWPKKKTPPPKKMVAIDYLTGQELDANEAKSRPLITMKEDGQIKFQAWNEGAIVPVLLHFYPFSECKADGTQVEADEKRGRIFQLLVCLEPMGGKCDNEGVLICFPGRLDPANRKATNPLFAIENIEGNELAARCNSKEMRRYWRQIWGKKTVLHALEFKTVEEGKIQLSTSFNKEKEVLTPFKGDGCIAIDIGIEAEQLIVHITSVEENEQNARAEPRQNQAELIERVANGVNLSDQKWTSILPLDMMREYDQSANKSLFGFVAPKSGDNGGEKCQMSVTVRGKSLKRCLNHKCTEEKDLDNPSQDEINKAYYKKDFARMKPLLSPEQLPKRYAHNVRFAMEKDRVRVIIYASTDEEVVFSMLTNQTDQSPTITIVRPKNADECMAKGDFVANEFLLAINARPDCYIRLGWDPTGVRMFDDARNDGRSVKNLKDVKFFIDGKKMNDLWATNEEGYFVILGTTPCSVGADDIGNNGEKDKNKMWKFIVNPKRGTPVELSAPRCELAISFYMDEATLMVDMDVKNSVDE